MAFLGEIRMFAGNTPPNGWAICDGSILPVAGNEGLLSSIGLSYGNGSQFQLPDLRSSVPVHLGPTLVAQNISLRGGQETVSLLPGQVPSHSHPAGASSSIHTASGPGGQLLAQVTIYNQVTNPSGSLASTSISVEGLGSAHPNIQPYLSLNFIICVSGGVPMTTGAGSGGSFAALGGLLMLSACGDTAPAGWARCDGQQVSRSTFSGLFAVLCPTVGPFTVTIASPAVFSLTAHGLTAGAAVYFTTTGALPTGITPNTIYYVLASGLTSNNFEVAATPGGSAIATTGSQSGTHIAVSCEFGLGDGSTTFDLPGLTNQTINGAGAGSGLTVYAVGTRSGENFHTLTIGETPAHVHTLNAAAVIGNSASPTSNFLAVSGIYSPTVDGTSLATSAISTSGVSGPSHENRQPFLGVTVLIATDDFVADTYTGEVRACPFASAPSGWQLCDGSSFTTSGQAALFAVIGYTFGGTGPTFNVPDLRGRVVVGSGTGSNLSAYALGQSGGAETVALTTNQMPPHGHLYMAVDDRAAGTPTSVPSSNILGPPVSLTPYVASGTLTAMNADMIRSAGGGGAHENRMGQCAFNFIIKL